MTIVSAIRGRLASEVPAPLTFAVAVNDAPGASAASPRHRPNAEVEAAGNVDESRHVARPSDVVNAEIVTPVLWLMRAARNVPLHVFVPLLMVVEVQLPDAQLMLRARLQGWAANSGTARKARERMNDENARRDTDFLLSLGVVTLRAHCRNHTFYRSAGSPWRSPPGRSARPRIPPRSSPDRWPWRAPSASSPRAGCWSNTSWPRSSASPGATSARCCSPCPPASPSASRAAEMIAVNSGLGFLIIDARNAGNRYDLVLAGMVLIGLIGVALDALVRRAEQRIAA